MRKLLFLETTSLFASIFTSICLGSEVFLSKPKNVAVIAGQRMEMECRTRNGSKVTAWYFHTCTSNSPPLTLVTNTGSKIQLGERISSEFGVKLDANGSGMIYFNSTTTDNAGIYTCEAEKDFNIIKFSAQLIVFESEPMCETNLREHSKLFTDEIISMRCNVSYRGNWLPTVEWRQHNGNGGLGDYVGGIPVIHGMVETDIANISVSSSLTVFANTTIDGSYFSLNVFFTSHNDSIRTNAMNIPEFRFTWNSLKISFDSTTVIDASSTKTTARIDQTPSQTFPGHLYLMVIVIVGVLLFVLSLLIAIVCWVSVRKKTAKWMADFVSTYENVDSRRSRISRNSMIDSRRCCSTMGNTTTRENNRPTSDGYTDVNFSQAYSEGHYIEEGASKFPKYSVAKKKSIGESTVSASNSDRNENDELYATLRTDIEPSKAFSIYASENDFNDEVSEDSTADTNV